MVNETDVSNDKQNQSNLTKITGATLVSAVLASGSVDAHNLDVGVLSTNGNAKPHASLTLQNNTHNKVARAMTDGKSHLVTA